MREVILGLCDDLEAKVVSMRRALHQIPEPSLGERMTQAKVSSFLKATGIPFESGVAGTGVVALLKGTAGPTIALRADMDGLNIEEKTGLAFASRNPGFMHACGHDAHMAMVLGAGLVLKKLGKRLPGSVKLIFQPAEETPPGGAQLMISAGALKAPRVRAVLGLHVDPVIPAGKVAVNAGPISAAADDFKIAITGKGGHGSSPHKGVDAIVVAAQFITSLQAIVSRRVGPTESVVVSIGYIKGGEGDNIIAERVEMGGTIRTKSKRLRRRVPAMIKKMLDSTCSAYGARGRLEYIEGYPSVLCDEKLTTLVRSACLDILGRSATTTSPGFEMGGEDFAYFAQQVPGTIIFVGVGNPKQGKTYSLHHSKFDIDEKALRVGVTALAYSAYRYLAGSTEKRHGKGK